MSDLDFAVSKVICYYCGNPSFLVMNRIGTKEKADYVRKLDGKVTDMKPCEECQQLFKKGIMLIGIDLKKSNDGWEDEVPMNPYRTGHVWLVTDEAFKASVTNPEVQKEALEDRWVFIDISVAEMLGLPLQNTDESTGEGRSGDDGK